MKRSTLHLVRNIFSPKSRGGKWATWVREGKVYACICEEKKGRKRKCDDIINLICWFSAWAQENGIELRSLRHVMAIKIHTEGIWTRKSVFKLNLNVGLFIYEFFIFNFHLFITEYMFVVCCLLLINAAESQTTHNMFLGTSIILYNAFKERVSGFNAELKATREAWLEEELKVVASTTSVWVSENRSKRIFSWCLRKDKHIKWTPMVKSRKPNAFLWDAVAQQVATNFLPIVCYWSRDNDKEKLWERK